MEEGGLPDDGRYQRAISRGEASSLRWKRSAASMTVLYFSSASQFFSHHQPQDHTFSFETFIPQEIGCYKFRHPTTIGYSKIFPPIRLSCPASLKIHESSSKPLGDMVNRSKTPKCVSPQGSDNLISDAKSGDGSCSGSLFSGDSRIIAPGIPPASRPAAKARRVAKKSLGTQEILSKKAEADEYEIPGGSSPPRPERSSKPTRKPPTTAKTPSPSTKQNKVGKDKLFKRPFLKKSEPLSHDTPAAAHVSSDMKNPDRDSSSSHRAPNEVVKGTRSQMPVETSLESVPQLPRSLPTSLLKAGQLDKPSGSLAEEEQREGPAVDGPIQIAFSDFSSHENAVSEGTLCLPPKTKHLPANCLTSHDTVQPIVPASPDEPPSRAFAPVDIDSDFIVRDTYGAASSPVHVGTASLKRAASPVGADYQKRTRINPKVQSPQDAEDPEKRSAVPKKSNHSLINLNVRYEGLRHSDVPLVGQAAVISGAPAPKPGKTLLQRFAEDDQEPTLPVLEKENIGRSDSPFETATLLPTKCNNLGRDNDCPSSEGIADNKKQTPFEGEWWETIRAILQVCALHLNEDCAVRGNALEDIKCREGLLDIFVSDLESLERQLLSVTKMHREDQASILRICRQNSHNIVRQCDKGRDSLRKITETARMTDTKRILLDSQTQTQRFVQVLQDLSRI
ncbi:hypothetical protein PspLS_10818 [Pyricularia sp. CBS 133598]|nr:hypothetical protein PspLS_10818 [Pyricularia sp. CBS 133598]